MKCHLDPLHESLSVSAVDPDVERALGIADFHETDSDLAHRLTCEDVLL